MMEKIDVNYDKWGEVINGKETIKKIAETLAKNHTMIIGWTDEEYTHLDILFSVRPERRGTLQRGLRWTDCFISIMGYGAFGFDYHSEYIFPGYIAEKLNLRDDSTTEKLGELINGIFKYARENL